MRKTKLFRIGISVFFLVLLFSGLNVIYSQIQRNPVLEFCTGTWCPFCPEGEVIIHNTILPNIPHAIILAYHGPANYSSDPFSFYPGNSILSSLGLSSYPTGIIDRVSGVQSRSTWYSLMNNRNSVPATVAIDISRNYNRMTREFSASIDFTALQNLSGEYKFNVILVEDGIVWPQNGALGGPNYVHDWTVRAMMNGALGEQIIDGTWTQGQQINKTVNYTVPVPPSPAPDIVPDSCRVVVMAYKVGSPLSSNAEIQQAIQTTLISPDYIATMVSQSPDVLASNTTIAQYSATIYNLGLMEDTYGIDISFQGPSGWSAEFTTVNGTFSASTVDSVIVGSGDSTTVTVDLNPNSIDGAGQVILHFISANNSGITDQIPFRLVTETGLNVLVVDATDDRYESYLTTALDKTGESYGVVSHNALQAPGVNLSNFNVICWSGANTVPAFSPEEVAILQNFLDNGGNLFITGQDIGNDIFGTNPQSQFAQSFYTNYLHANFVNNSSLFFLVNGYTGDPITDGLNFIISDLYTRSPEIISAYDSLATPILKYMTGPNVAGLRAATPVYKVVYLGIGFEQISDEPDRDSILVRSIRWFNQMPTNIDDRSAVKLSFKLESNYPNPFNPETIIHYTLNNPAPEATQLIIFNSLGQSIRQLVNEKQVSGNYQVIWDGKDDGGRPAASGVYYYQLSSGQKKAVQKMILLR